MYINDRQLLHLGLLVGGVLLFVLVISFYTSRNVRLSDNNDLVVEPSTFFANVELNAKSAIVWDILKQATLFEKKADQSLPLASLTKIMMALTAVDLVPDYTVISINKEFLQEEGDSGLFANEKWKLKDLIDLALVVSSNDAAAAIASVTGAHKNGSETLNLGKADFIAAMNQKATEIGMSQTKFFSENGLDTNGEVGGAYGSARDIARLFEYIVKKKPEILEATKYSTIEISSLNNISHKIKNTNLVTNVIPGLVASKTGYTELSGGNLAIVLDPAIGRPIVIVVLGSTYDARFDDAHKLSLATLAYLSTQ